MDNKNQLAAILADVPNTVKKSLLQPKLQIWKNTVADLKMDLDIAQVTDNQHLVDDITDRLKGAMKAVAEIERMMTEIDGQLAAQS